MLVFVLSFGVLEEHEVAEKNSGHEQSPRFGVTGLRWEGDEEVVGVSKHSSRAALGSLLENTDGFSFTTRLSDFEGDSLAGLAEALG